MKKKHLLLSSITGLVFLMAMAFLSYDVKEVPFQSETKKAFQDSKMSREESKKARADYFFEMLKDPKTGKIPDNIRARELKFAHDLKVKNQGKRTTSEQSWFEAGPNNVGGRTRALALDIRDSNTVLAGGVNGGLWKSTDGGESWTLKSDPAFNASVTSLAQDPVNPDTWYFAGGEFSGASASNSFEAFIYNNGLFKSTDNGETWEFQTYSTEDNSLYTLDADPDLSLPTIFNTFFRYSFRIAISPINSDIYIAVAGGVLQSKDGGNTFNKIIHPTAGEFNRFTDVIVDQSGHVTVTLGELEFDGTEGGIFRSLDNGETWIDVTPETFPAEHQRSVLAFAPSNPSIVYCHTYLGFSNGDGTDAISFHKFDFTNLGVDGTFDAEDYSSNIGQIAGNDRAILAQGNYNMCIAVKPDDENHVVIGSTNLLRSRDGFSTRVDDLADNWIGGYDNFSGGLYPNHHPDQHYALFDPNDPDLLWSSHDGGISRGSVTTDGSAMEWEDMNNGYNVTQFYAIAMGKIDENDNRFMGGTQDNATPFMVAEENITTPRLYDALINDGGFCYLGEEFAFTTFQNGFMLMTGYDLEREGFEGVPSPFAPFSEASPRWAFIAPAALTGQLFIHPLKVDPLDEKFVYTPGGNDLWRNTNVEEIPNFNQQPTSVNWERLDNIASAGASITVLEPSSDPEKPRLYFAAQFGGGAEIFRLANPQTAGIEEVVDISIGAADLADAYPNDIAVNPRDGDELLLSFANYNIVGLYHSPNGGDTFTAVEGNLTGSDEFPGPSIRSVQIMDLGEGGAKYFVGTSIGLFSTTSLNGDDTEWVQEAPEVMGNVVVSDIDVRFIDNKVLVGTHGRGAFIGNSEQSELVADFDPSSIVNIEVGGSVQFVNRSRGRGLSYNWTFEGGIPSSSTDENPLVNYENAGEFDVTLVVTDENGEVVEQLKEEVVQVSPLAITAGFRVSAIEIFEGQEVEFTNLSEGEDLQYQWAFEGGTPESSTDENPLVTYSSEGVYDVTLTIIDMFGQTDVLVREDFITVNPTPPISASFTVESQEEMFDVPIQFTSTSTGAGELTYLWTFEGGNPETSEEPNPLVSYEEVGTYDVSLVVTDSLGQEATIMESDYMTITFNPITSIDDELASSLEVFPVPATDRLTLRLAQATNLAVRNVKVYDTQGKSVKPAVLEQQASEWVLDVSALSSGSYLTEIEVQPGVWVKKRFIKQ